MLSRNKLRGRAFRIFPLRQASSFAEASEDESPRHAVAPGFAAASQVRREQYRRSARRSDPTATRRGRYLPFAHARIGRSSLHKSKNLRLLRLLVSRRSIVVSEPSLLHLSGHPIDPDYDLPHPSSLATFL